MEGVGSHWCCTWSWLTFWISRCSVSPPFISLSFSLSLSLSHSFPLFSCVLVSLHHLVMPRDYSVVAPDSISPADQSIDLICLLLLKMRDGVIDQRMGALQRCLCGEAMPRPLNTRGAVGWRCGFRIAMMVENEMEWLGCRLGGSGGYQDLGWRWQRKGTSGNGVWDGSDAIWLQSTGSRGKKWMKSRVCGGGPLVLNGTLYSNNSKKKRVTAEEISSSSFLTFSITLDVRWLSFS